jgi:flagellar hook protein FlgE
MFTAIGGLKNHQVMMDVTANNIANVNTIGYKDQRASFASMLSQTVRGASAPTAGGAGGVNPTQVGLGVTLQGVSSVLTQGSSQTTGQWNDMLISGDGYFVVSPKSATSALAATDGCLFTRSGNFNLDVNGDLVTASGQYVMGSSVASAGPPPTFNSDLKNINIPTTAKAVSVGGDGVVTYVDGNGAQQIAGQIAVAKFPNPAGLTRQGDNLYTVSPNSGSFDATQPNNGATPTAGQANWGSPGLDGRGGVISGQLEMSNVDLAQEFTSMITAQRGFQANSRVISASDEMLQDLVNMKH